MILNCALSSDCKEVKPEVTCIISYRQLAPQSRAGHRTTPIYFGFSRINYILQLNHCLVFLCHLCREQLIPTPLLKSPHSQLTPIHSEDIPGAVQVIHSKEKTRHFMNLENHSSYPCYGVCLYISRACYCSWPSYFYIIK